MIQECKTFEKVYSKIIARNFDYERDHPLLMGLSFFLFSKLSSIFTEDLNLYYIMEKFMSQVFQQMPVIHFEFLIFLKLLQSKEQGAISSKVRGLRHIISGLQLERMREIFQRCCGHILNVR